MSACRMRTFPPFLLRRLSPARFPASCSGRRSSRSGGRYGISDVPESSRGWPTACPMPRSLIGSRLRRACASRTRPSANGAPILACRARGRTIGRRRFVDGIRGQRREDLTGRTSRSTGFTRNPALRNARMRRVDAARRASVLLRSIEPGNGIGARTILRRWLRRTPAILQGTQHLWGWSGGGWSGGGWSGGGHRSPGGRHLRRRISSLSWFRWDLNAHVLVWRMRELGAEDDP